MSRLRPLLTVFVLLVGGLLGWVAAETFNTADARSGAAPVIRLGTPSSFVLTTNTIPDMVQATENAVVEITAQVQDNSNPFYPGATAESLGSGFFISPQGEILTNQHVINGATHIMVQIPGHAHLYPARVIGTDYNLDLALLKVDVPFTVPYLTFANPSSIRVGQFAVAIGNPDGLQQTVTLGIVSAEGRPITIGNRQYVNLLQTDAAINPGNSGGPLLNLNGQVVGVNTAVQANAQGVGFAIPVSEVLQALPYLQEGKTMPQAWLGVAITDVNPQVDQGSGLPSDLYGAMITSLLPGGPAAKVGLRSGDVVISFNGRPVTSSTDLLNDVLGEPPGTVVRLGIWRNGKTLTVTVRLGTKPQNIQ